MRWRLLCGVRCVFSATPDRQRLFFALWPEVSLQESIDTKARELIGKAAKCVPAHNLHITLAFLGAASPEQRVCYEQAAAGIQAPAFPLTLEYIGHWPAPRILWLGPTLQPEPLLNLVRGLNSALARCGFAPEARPFQAHMTLARKVDRPLSVQRIDPIVWPVRQFVLAESVAEPTGARYLVLTRWPLQDARPASD